MEPIEVVGGSTRQGCANLGEAPGSVRLPRAARMPGLWGISVFLLGQLLCVSSHSAFRSGIRGES